MNTLRTFIATPPPPDSIDWLDLSVRGRNVLMTAGLSTIPQLLAAPGNLIMMMRNSGEVTWKEITRALLQKFYKPQWLQEVTSRYHYAEVERLTEEEAAKLKTQGWNCITSGYKSPSEYWMLERAIADLERGGIEHRLYRVENEGVRIFRRGGIVSDDVSEDEA